MLKTRWGDAQVWMRTAADFYGRNEDAFQRGPSGYPRTSELNVAAVCAGYAFELVYKVLVEASGGESTAVHRPSAAHNKLGENDRVEVERIVSEHGWSIRDFLCYLDEKLCHGDRKYWMKPAKPAKGAAPVRFHIGGRYGLDELGKLHAQLSDLAMRRINETRHEVWPGTPDP